MKRLIFIFLYYNLVYFNYWTFIMISIKINQCYHHIHVKSINVYTNTLIYVFCNFLFNELIIFVYSNFQRFLWRKIEYSCILEHVNSPIRNGTLFKYSTFVFTSNIYIRIATYTF